MFWTPCIIKNEIANLGIKHYTKSKHIDKILKSGSIGIKPNEKVYFFVNKPIARDLLCYNLRFKGNNGGIPDERPSLHSIAGKDVAIIIRNLSKSQINEFRYDFGNEALEYPRHFVFQKSNKISVEKAYFGDYPKFSNNIIFKFIVKKVGENSHKCSFDKLS